MIHIVGPGLSQWDTGRSVTVTESGANEVHFANPGDTHAVIMELVDGGAKIPDYLFRTGKPLIAYAVQDGITLERKIFPVKKRPRPENYVYEDDQRNYIYKLIDDAQAAINAANQVAQDLLKAKENGEFNGKDADPVDLSNYYTKEEIDQAAEGLLYGMASENYVNETIDLRIGDISSALTELHTYAESLKGGEAV